MKLWAPKVRHCHIAPITLSFLFFFSFFLSSLLIFLSLFLCIYSSFCSSSEQKAHTHRPLTRSLTRRPTPVTHTPTTQRRHADPSREIIDVDLWSHAEKIHHTIILLIVAIVLILRSGRSVEIDIHSNGGSPLETIGNDSIWKLVLRSRSSIVGTRNSSIRSSFLIWKLLFFSFFFSRGIS